MIEITLDAGMDTKVTELCPMRNRRVYYLGVVLIAVLLVLEHRLVKPKDMSHIHTAFFTINSYIATVAFIFTFSDVLFRII